MSFLKEVHALFPVRIAADQKRDFRVWAAKQVEKAGYAAREEDNEGHINLIIGDPTHARAVFTAHYDTPRRALLPNLMLPTHRVLHLLYAFVAVLPILIPSLLAAYLFAHSLGGFADMRVRFASLLLYLGFYFALFFLVLKGPANRSNKNDNTSGTAAVLELARLLHGCNDAAFILFDDEEKGKKGSKAWAKAHPDAKANALIINMDCVGNGDRFIVCVPDPARGDAAYPALETALKSIEAGVYPARKTAMNSDQKSFDKGIGICACLYKKGIGCYTPRIHTSRDTVASNKNISALCGALAEFVKSIAG